MLQPQATDPFSSGNDLGGGNGDGEIDLGLEELEASQGDLDLSHLDEDLKSFETNEVVKQALAQGVDLRSYSKKVDGDLRALEIASVPTYLENAAASAVLHTQIRACDQILESMQQTLLGFQADLGGISDEIKSLQESSLSMNVKLRNRKAAEARLHEFIENLVVSDALIAAVCQGEVDEAYLAHLRTLNSKLRYIRSKDAIGDGGDDGVAPCDTAAAQDVGPQLERLRLKAVSKVRTFLLAQIATLKKPKTNVQIMQQNVLLKFRSCCSFLSEHAPAVAEEVRATYVDTMSRTLYALFKSYTGDLGKLLQPSAGKDDVIAVEESRLRSLAAGSYALDAREALLGDPDAPPLIVHVAQSERQRYPYEALFRSVQKHLMDSASSEHLFLIDFFKVKGRDLFNQVFARTLSLCLENLENYLYSCNDVVAVLLMIRVTQSHRLTMEGRGVPCLDGYFDHVNMMLWPHFKRVFDANAKSVRSASVRKLGTIELRPHYITRRYADFASAVFALNKTLEKLNLNDGMVTHNLGQLRGAFEGLLQRLSAEHPTKKAQRIFMINNYDQVLHAFSEVRHASSPDDTARFEELLSQQTALFVEDELSESFGRIITFVKQAETRIAAGDTSVDDGTVGSLIREFAANWKSGLELINSSVSAYFPNAGNRMEILKQVLTQLLLYYTRFQDLTKQYYGSGQGPGFLRELVSIQTIMIEIRRYSRAGAEGA